MGGRCRMKLHEFLEIAERAGLQPRQRANGEWRMKCPAHEDDNPSLDIREGERGLLLQCRAGCSVEAVCSALGINVGDLFFNSFSDRPPRGCSLSDLAQNCQVLRKTLIELGCREVQYDGAPAVAFPFQTSDGRVFYHYRIAVDGKDKWRLQAGAPAKQLVFGLEHALQRVQQTNTFIITESPLDSSVLFACGFASASVIGKANASALSEFRDCIPTDCQIFVWVEPQADDFAQGVANALQRPVFAFHSPNPQAKDAYRLLKANGWDIMKTRDQVVCAMQATVEVFPPPKTLAEILDSIVRFLRKYVVLSPEQADTIALWVTHTYAIDATDTTPYLRINSATKRCGKTRLAEVVSCIAYNPRLMTCLTTASLFRLIHNCEGKLTLIVDEVAGTFTGREKSAEISALLNAGWRRGMTVPRVEKTKDGSFVVREYQTFAPKVLVGIGQLHDTVEDRSIKIMLQRKRPDEKVEDFFLSDAFREAEPIRRGLEQWASQPEVIETLRRARPEMLRSVSDRAREGWRILVAIADMAGSEWGERARKAMLELERNREAEDTALNVRLLAALREIFSARNADKLSVQEIAESLQDLEDPPVPEEFWKWVAVSDWRRVGVWLSKTLKPFGIKSTQIKVEGRNLKGYLRKDCEEAWLRYLSPDITPPTPDTHSPRVVAFSTPNATKTLPENFNKNTQGSDGSDSSDRNIYRENALKLTESNDQSIKLQPVAVAFSYIPNATIATNATSQENQAFSGSVPANQNATIATNSINLPETQETDVVRWLCARCWLEVERPIDMDLFGVPRCPQCGQPIRELPPEPPDGGSPSRQPQTDDASEPTEVGEKFVDTLEFLQQNLGPLQEVQSYPFAEKEVPQEVIDQWLADSSDLTLDQWLQRKCRLTANLLLVFLRSFQRRSKPHQKCLKDPCPECQKRIAIVKGLERDGDLLTLQKLLAQAKAKMGRGQKTQGNSGR